MNTGNETDYYSHPRCGTCRWHCRNQKLDIRKFRKPDLKPWVCGNEDCSKFNRATSDMKNGGCQNWEQRNVGVWIAENRLIRYMKDAVGKGSNNYHFHHLHNKDLYLKIKSEYDDMIKYWTNTRLRLYGGEGQPQRVNDEIAESVVIYLANNYRVTIGDIKECLRYGKENYNV